MGIKVLIASAMLAACGAASVAAAELRLLAAELPPYTFHVPPPTVSESGEARGALYDVVRAWRNGRPLRHHRVHAVDARPGVRPARPDAGILALARSPEREPNYSWIARILVDDLVLVGGAGVDVSDLDKVKDRPVGVLRRSGAEALLRERGFTRIVPAKAKSGSTRRRCATA